MRIINLNSRLIIILLSICGLLTMDYGLTYAQPAKLTLPGDVTAQSIILDPQDLGSITCDEGRVVYNSNDEQLYYCNGTNWNVFGGGAGHATVGARIVAAYNSLGSIESDGTPCEVGDFPCNNPKADSTCNGASDQQEINTAINDLTAGGAVYLLEGTYNISSSIVPKSNISIIGAGKGTLLTTTGSINIINASGITRILISQLSLQNGERAINFDGNVTGSKIDKVWVENALDKGIFLFNSNYNTISNITVSGASSNWGIELISSSNNIIYNNNINTKNGVYLHATISPSSNNNIVSGNSIYMPLVGVYIKDGSVSNIVSGNYIEKSGTDTIYGITVENNSNTNKISGNRIIGTGIKLDLASNFNTVLNNVISQSDQDGIYVGSSENIISRNIVSNSTRHGIVIEGVSAPAKALYNIISSNLIKSFGGYGIAIQQNYETSMNYLAGNLILGQVNKRIYDPTGYFYTRTKSTDKARVTFFPDFNEIIDPDKITGRTLNPGVSSYKLLSTATYRGTSFGCPAIVDGKYPGDTLILENIIGSWDITIPDGCNTQLRGNSDKILGQQDTISLIWNGTDWIETGFINKSN